MATSRIPAFSSMSRCFALMYPRSAQLSAISPSFGRSYSGKVNPRPVRVVAAAPELKEWLAVHPMRKDPSAPLWLDPDDTSKPLSYEKARYMLRRIAKEARVEKRVYLYLFRHSCITALAHRCSDAELEEIFGWTQGTKMLARYMRDIDPNATAIQQFCNAMGYLSKSVRMSAVPRAELRARASLIRALTPDMPLANMTPSSFR